MRREHKRHKKHTAQRFPDQGETGMLIMPQQGMRYPFSQYYTGATFSKKPYKTKI